MFTLTRLIEHSYKPSAYNMAVDEAILFGNYKYPTLRFYQWKTPTLSIGHNQTIDKKLASKLQQNKILITDAKQRSDQGFCHPLGLSKFISIDIHLSNQTGRK